MIAAYVPPILTPISRDDALRALRWALPDGTSDSGVALCAAQWALETGRGKHCYNSNFGNCKAGDKYVGNYTSRRCNEVIDGKLRWFLPEGECDRDWRLLSATAYEVPPGHPQTRFRAYAGLHDGALEHVGLLEKRFGSAYQAMLTGDPNTFVLELDRLNYFTADPTKYLAGIRSIAREFHGALYGQNPPEIPVGSDIADLLKRADAAIYEAAWSDDAVVDTPRT